MDSEIRETEDRITIEPQEREVYKHLNGNKYRDIFSAVIRKKKDVELDLSHVEILDSLFIGSVIVLFKTLREKKMRLLMRGLTSHLEKIFKQMNLKFLWKSNFLRKKS